MKKNRVTTYLIGILLSLSLFVSCSAAPNKKVEAIGKPKVNAQQETKGDNTEKINTKESEIYFINTGQSDSILIKGEKNILIDGGNNENGKDVVKFLKDKDVSVIHYMIATHNDADHIGGLDDVLKNIKVENTLVSNGDADTKTYRDFINAIVEKGLKPSVPLPNKEIPIGKDSYLKFYNTNGGEKKNDQSLVTLYVHGNDKILFMGDAEKDTENEIVKELEDVDVLKVGHHGSRTSTTDELLNKVKPEIAVICVGVDNKYNLPHKATMNKLEERKIEVYRTDEGGTIELKSTGNGIVTQSKKGGYSYRDNKKNTEVKKESNSSSSSKAPTKTENTQVNSNKEVGEEVYITATGKKYHKINNCGKTNPNNTSKMNRKEAEEQGYDSCSNCF